MNVEIKNKVKNELLHRTTVTGSLKFKGATPSNDKLKEKLAALMNSNTSLIEVIKIATRYGFQEGVFEADIYDNLEEMAKIVKKGKKRKEAEAKLEEAKKKAEEEKAAAKAESEKPKEESKVEEAPAEKKTEEPEKKGEE